MRLRASLYVAMGSLAAVALVAPLAGQGRQGPGIQAPADAREPELLKSCKNTQPPAPAGRRGGEGGGLRGDFWSDAGGIACSDRYAWQLHDPQPPSRPALRRPGLQPQPDGLSQLPS